LESITQQNNGKEEKISKIIDKVLKQVFGEEAARLIYKHLKNNYDLKQDEVAEKIEVFATGLETFLRSGAYVIERKILEDIHASYGSLHESESEETQEDSDFISQMKSLVRRA
jgi:hypothetical protein